MGLRFFKRGNKYNGVSDALHSIRQEFEAIWNKIDNYTAPDETAVAEQSTYVPCISTDAYTAYRGPFTIRVRRADSSGNYIIDAVHAETLDIYPPAGLQTGCNVNDKYYEVPYTEHEVYVPIITEQPEVTYTHYYALLVFTHVLDNTESEEGAELEDHCDVVVEPYVNEYGNQIDLNSYFDRSVYILGTVSFGSDGTYYIAQSHVTGVPQVWWFDFRAGYACDAEVSGDLP